MGMKGFFITLDVMFALIVVGILVAAFSFSMGKGQEDYHTISILSKFANDVLVILDKNNTLNTLNQEEIENVFSNILPNNYAGNLTVKTYEYQGGNFQLNNQFTINSPSGSKPDENTVTVRRYFLAFNESRIGSYNIAELKMWLR